MTRFHSLCVACCIALGAFSGLPEISACTGISLKSKDGSKIVGRTMEWGSEPVESQIVVSPRGFSHRAVTPSGENGLLLQAKYGYVGIGTLDGFLLEEGMNEKGLVAELFYFPGYGECRAYDPSKNDRTLTDAQFLEWALINFATISELEAELDRIEYVSFGNGMQTIHYNLADATGRQVVIEFYDDRFHVHENKIGVITNSPGFNWHMTNLNNYVNLFAGSAAPQEIMPGVTLRSLGMGSASLGLPGDLTPPSRFVRAAFYAQTARPQETGEGTVKQVFQILNNFDIPVGVEFKKEEPAPDMLSATQWTSVVDVHARKFYYRTEWNYLIRCIDFNQIDFRKVRRQLLPMDPDPEYPVVPVKIG